MSRENMHLFILVLKKITVILYRNVHTSWIQNVKEKFLFLTAKSLFRPVTWHSKRRRSSCSSKRERKSTFWHVTHERRRYLAFFLVYDQHGSISDPFSRKNNPEVNDCMSLKSTKYDKTGRPLSFRRFHLVKNVPWFMTATIQWINE